MNKNLPPTKETLMLFDGHSMIFRSWYAIRDPVILRKTGEDIRAVRGFTSSFLKNIGEFRPSHCVMTFDTPEPTFRHNLYPEYKAHRSETPEGLYSQFDRVRQVVEAFDVPIFELPGYEADDLLGSLSSIASQYGLHTIIVTGDTDALQLVGPRISVLLNAGSGNQKIYDESAVQERYLGLLPSQLPELKALQGDTSDNIPGVPGIGEKTGIKLIQHYNTLDNLYAHVNEVESARIKDLLIANKELAYRSKALAKIVVDLPLKFNVEQSQFSKFERKKVVTLFNELEFAGLVSRIPDSTEASSASSMATSIDRIKPFNVVRNAADMESVTDTINQGKELILYFVTLGQNPMESDVLGVAFSSKEGQFHYLSLLETDLNSFTVDKRLSMLRTILENDSIGKVTHNANYLLTICNRLKAKCKNLSFDTMIAAALGGSRGATLETLVFNRLSIELTSPKTVFGTKIDRVDINKIAREQVAAFACERTDAIGKLKDSLMEELKINKQWKLFQDVEMNLLPILVEMQLTGVTIDAQLLKTLSLSASEKLESIERQVYNLAGREFNIASPSQLGMVLFAELQLPSGKRTKTGYSTDVQVLEPLRNDHLIVDLVLQYRELTKLQSTYLDVLPVLQNPVTGRVHTSYNQVGTTTGRISSSDPNLQNIPVRTVLGREVRKAFVASDSDNWKLLSADYSQIELRVLAHISGDENLQKAFLADEDVHASTAATVYDVSLSEVTPEMRRIAKVMNFGVIYGLSPFGISRQTNLTMDEGAEFVDICFGRYPGIKSYIENTKRYAKDNGYVETLLGRRRYLPEIISADFQTRHAAERMAVNMPIQGSAADILKIATIDVYERLNTLKLSSKMVLHVHDELIFEAKNDEVELLIEEVKSLMTLALPLNVPLKVDVKLGNSWGDMEHLDHVPDL